MIKEFKRANTIDEAVKLSQEGYVFLAGGTQVNNTPFKKWGKKIEKVVSLDSLKLGKINMNGKTLEIGSMVTLQSLADSSAVPKPLREAAGFIPTRSVRNIATIGGNVGAGRPDSYIIPALIAYEAEAELFNGKRISVEKYVLEGDNSLILKFHLPLDGGVVIALKESRSQLALPVVSAAVSIAGGKGKISNVILALGCVSPKCIRLSDLEKKLIDGTIDDDPALEDSIARLVTPKQDILGSSAYKTYINSVRVADAIRSALKEVRK